MNEIYLREAKSQIGELIYQANNIESLLERAEGNKLWCTDCMMDVFSKDDRCIRCGKKFCCTLGNGDCATTIKLGICLCDCQHKHASPLCKIRLPTEEEIIAYEL